MMNLGVRILLASSSPRRSELLSSLGFDFEVVEHQALEEYPDNLFEGEIAAYLSEIKAMSLFSTIKPDELVIAADTIVYHKGAVLEKPASPEKAARMLRKLGGSMHKVYTGVTLMNSQYYHTFVEETEVWFNPIDEDEIQYYIKNFSPFDKAGAYGIQEWLGIAKVSKIVGSYNNVVGLPTAELYREIKRFLAQAK
ncbi:MAG: septum formation protein Maf [Flavobacteriales bacterium]|nr:MAG: septum formation protein Maf [Flavobacteriales bacterium]